jgi:hypothetical protein
MLTIDRTFQVRDDAAQPVEEVRVKMRNFSECIASRRSDQSVMRQKDCLDILLLN